MARWQTSSVNKLSDKENEVLSWIIQGFSNKEIGKRMKVTEKCIKFHLSTIYKITQVKTARELLVAYYKKKGYFENLERT